MEIRSLLSVSTSDLSFCGVSASGVMYLFNCSMFAYSWLEIAYNSCSWACIYILGPLSRPALASLVDY